LEVEESLIAQALALELQQGNVIKDMIKTTECVFLGSLYASERGIADRLGILNQGSLPWPDIDADKAIEWVEEKHAIALSVTQKQALKQALQAKVMIITGGPGVGKTTLATNLALALARETSRSVALVDLLKFSKQNT